MSGGSAAYNAKAHTAFTVSAHKHTVIRNTAALLRCAEVCAMTIPKRRRLMPDAGNILLLAIDLVHCRGSMLCNLACKHLPYCSHRFAGCTPRQARHLLCCQLQAIAWSMASQIGAASKYQIFANLLLVTCHISQPLCCK